MGNSTVKSHQATEVRLKSRRKVNRPLRPIPSRAIEAGSGTTAVVVGKLWLMMDMATPRLPPTTLMSFSTRIELAPAKLVVSEMTGLVIDRLPMPAMVTGFKRDSPTDTVPVVPVGVSYTPDRLAR